ncbi:hypothetical protein [uncultured Dysgonomonas sp.]|uniref:Tyr recombinase domain-containing protein n=1 Tax=uncultured Dysgonomonas sp. TaxID=206096 RepID=A0A212IWU3_9BACT|nr:hypothetical protein [uncultured Dysgonomonas sp.]SBV91678.1 conserved hypothetical protein [uncultured Dysgonomonas sp.]
MATIKAFIRTTVKSKKVFIRLRLSDGRDFTRYGVTNIEVLPEFWDAARQEVKNRAILPKGFNKEEINTAVKFAKEKIEQAYKDVADNRLLSDDWIDNVLLDKKQDVEDEKPTTSELFHLYLSESKVSESRLKQVAVAGRMLERFTLVNNMELTNKASVLKFEEFLRNEHLIQKIYPQYYTDVKDIKPRGQNTLNSKLKMISAFYSWALKNKHLDSHPFEDFEFSPDVYGDPIPLLPEEVELIFNSKVHKGLDLVKDMFCLQCYLGCRVDDFVHLKKSNVNGDILTYVASKTINSNPKTVYVPLVDNAISIINKYGDSDDRLIPFMNVDGKDGYNKQIKNLLQYLKIDRSVVIINPITRQPETKKIYEVASTHTARRTFINSNYKETQDPALIAQMTGHSENSRSFSRYRNIDIDILREQVKKAYKSK